MSDARLEAVVTIAVLFVALLVVIWMLGVAF